MAHKRGLDGVYLKPTREQCFEEFEKAIASGQEQHIVTVSMIPSYLIAAISLISIILLYKIDFEKLKE